MFLLGLSELGFGTCDPRIWGTTVFIFFTCQNINILFPIFTMNDIFCDITVKTVPDTLMVYLEPWGGHRQYFLLVLYIVCAHNVHLTHI